MNIPIISKNFLCLLVIYPSLPIPWQPLLLCHSELVCIFQNLYIIGVIQYMLFVSFSHLAQSFEVDLSCCMYQSLVACYWLSNISNITCFDVKKHFHFLVEFPRHPCKKSTDCVMCVYFQTVEFHWSVCLSTFTLILLVQIILTI